MAAIYRQKDQGGDRQHLGSMDPQEVWGPQIAGCGRPSKKGQTPRVAGRPSDPVTAHLGAHIGTRRGSEHEGQDKTPAQRPTEGRWIARIMTQHPDTLDQRGRGKDHGPRTHQSIHGDGEAVGIVEVGGLSPAGLKGDVADLEQGR